MSRALRIGASLLCFVLALAAAAPSSAQPLEFRQGLSAFNRGAYLEALHDWLPLARSGDPDSQSGVGFLYYKGLGVPQDYVSAHEWYDRAAKQGQPEAQLFLGAMFLFGDGVPRDLVKAYAWCEISQSRGALGGLSCRDQAAQQMTPGQMEAANSMVAAWNRSGPQRE